MSEETIKRTDTNILQRHITSELVKLLLKSTDPLSNFEALTSFSRQVSLLSEKVTLFETERKKEILCKELEPIEENPEEDGKVIDI